MVLTSTKTSTKGHHGKKGKTVYIHMGVWYNKKTGHIHIAAPKEGKLHSTICNNPKSKRYHPNLYKKLRDILERYDRWL